MHPEVDISTSIENVRYQLHACKNICDNKRRIKTTPLTKIQTVDWMDTDTDLKTPLVLTIPK
jgi:hypothetical protein